MIFFIAKGYMAAAALIIALGAQNAFVLAQGVKRQHHWPVAATCFLVDAILISLGMVGAGVVIQHWPNALTVIQIGGFIFLFGYGFCAFKAFLMPAALTASQAKGSLKSALITTLAVSCLNPHVYLDTVVLLGSLGNQFTGSEKYSFWIGAILASFSWFVLLTLLAKALSPWLAKPAVWRWVEALVGVMMWTIAAWLLSELLE
ncbi:LysE/ArgO family amino acid transporter [Neptunomonas japonica]|uniref:LysE family amino acid exporter n=1 Tax=Neptunomonas japonica JAMM 1380 TaxID=1441457 RepID=A0A7R6PBY0_9GAMM|nr:LysE family transporter [Neptunomonas japonica]BBB30933.1 LysE family amino acid exporter [Neptunomonas japonica JAMM 1380]